MKNLNINGREIGKGRTPYIIAEMSANHNGKIENAFKIIDMAVSCGADALKDNFISAIPSSWSA